MYDSLCNSKEITARVPLTSDLQVPSWPKSSAGTKGAERGHVLPGQAAGTSCQLSQPSLPCSHFNLQNHKGKTKLAQTHKDMHLLLFADLLLQSEINGMSKIAKNWQH